MSAPPVGGTARALGIHLGLAGAGLDMHFGDGFAEKNPVLVVVAASLLLHQQATGEGLETIKYAIDAQQEVTREGFDAVRQAIGLNRLVTAEGFDAIRHAIGESRMGTGEDLAGVCEAVAELAVVVAGLNA